MSYKINVPTDIAKLKNLKKGSEVLLSGNIYSARDAAHKRLKKMAECGENIPIDFNNAIIYYMGPTPSRPGRAIGSCGPTSSYRMDNLLETTLKLGVAATIGKGERSNIAFSLCNKYKSPYLVTIGGAAAYLAACVRACRPVLFEDLGAEAVYELSVKDFPIYVLYDVNTSVE